MARHIKKITAILIKMSIVYKVHTKHRVASPTENASVWDITQWQEISLFAKAGEMRWESPKKKYLWAMQDNFALLGRGLSKGAQGKAITLHIAKFVEDNSTWHGYPVQARGNDIPPESVLNDWLERQLINKAEKLKIIGGKFK